LFSVATVSTNFCGDASQRSDIFAFIRCERRYTFLMTHLFHFRPVRAAA